MEKLNMNSVLKPVAYVVLMCISAWAADASSLTNTKRSYVKADGPNFIFFMIDDMGWKDLGFMGSSYYETPNIDRLAGRGMVFTNAYANAANCAPSRACFLTGQYTPRHGVYTVSNPDRGSSKDRRLISYPNDTTLDADHVTIAEVLGSAGYVSASMGKWHMGDPPNLGPQQQGFDVNIGGGAAGSPYKGYFVPYRNPWNLPDGPEGEYLTDRLSEEAVTFIKANKDRPFFLYLTHYAVHTPIQAKADLTAKYEDKPGTELPWHNNAKYAAMVESVDQGVGLILDTLEELDLSEQTVVFFFSDNGGYAPATDMYPLRGSKGMFYEGGIRVPMIASWPGHIQAETQCDVPVMGIDFFPTLLDLAGVTKPRSKFLDGESLVPILMEEGQWTRDALFWHFPAYLQKYSAGMDEARDPKFRSRPVGVIRKGQWKLLMFFEEWILDGGMDAIDTNNAIELYNLENDIGETINLAGERTDIRDTLLQELIAWQHTVGAPVYEMTENPGYRAPVED